MIDLQGEKFLLSLRKNNKVIMVVDIKRTILRSGMTMPQVAEVMGMTRQGLFFYEKQGNKINVSTLEKIANIIGCKVEDFFYQDENDVKNLQKPTLTANCPYCGESINITKITLAKADEKRGK